MTTTFENARVGDRVWCMINGWGIVSLVDKESDCPIEVDFDNEQDDSYTFCGKAFEASMWRILFWDEVKIIAPKQPQRMKLVHGVEVPDISFTPKNCQIYYCPDARNPELFSEFHCRGGDIDAHLLHQDMCYPYTEAGKAAAILHAKAMLGINPE